MGFFFWEGKQRSKRVDVLATNGQKKTIFQVGNHSEFEIDLLKRFFETHYIPYPPFDPFPQIEPNNSESLQEKKKRLLGVYQRVFIHFKEDGVFDFIGYDEENKASFKLGRERSWMLIPHSSTLGKNELMENINIRMEYLGDGFFEIAINAELNEAVRKFLRIHKHDKERFIEIVNHLPGGYYIQDGFKFREKGKYSAKRMRRDWKTVKPYKGSTFSMEDLDDIESRMNYLLENQDLRRYPVFTILGVIVKEAEMLQAFLQIKPIYQILKTMKSTSQTIIQQIKSIKNWEWYIDNREFVELHEIYSEKFKKDRPSQEEFKSACRKLIKDPDFIRYKTT